MNISDLIRLSNAHLLSSPSITYVLDYVFDSKKVKPKDAFFAIDRSAFSINEAVKNGAYAIFYDFETKIIDQEIAWIKVENLEMAMMRIVRFISNQKKLNFILLSSIQKSILENFKLPKNCHILSSNIEEIFKVTLNANEEKIFFTSNKNLLQQISPQYDCIYCDQTAKIFPKSNIFISTFLYKDIYFHNLPISIIFIPSFAGIINYLNNKKISYEIKPFKSLPHFEPIFINQNFEIQPFGSTSQALIIEKDKIAFEMEINYLNNNLKHINFISFSPRKNNISFTSFVYDDIEELLLNNKFQYSLILGDIDEIKLKLEKRKSLFQPSLF